MNTFASAFGKIILTGEFAAVYGYPAIALPIPLHTTVEIVKRSGKGALNDNAQKMLKSIAAYFSIDARELTINITSTIPQNFGLGSSAALSCATAKAFSSYAHRDLTSQQLFELVQKCEHIFHGKPSGVDAAAVSYQQCIRLQKSDAKTDIVPLHVTLPKFLLIDSGKATETTKEMIELVGKHPQKEAILKKIGAVTEKIEQSLKAQSFDASLITENEMLLEQLGVVGQNAERIIRLIEKAGGAAKIAGAGGKQSGSGVIIAFHSDMREPKRCCKINGIPILSTKEKI